MITWAGMLRLDRWACCLLAAVFFVAVTNSVSFGQSSSPDVLTIDSASISVTDYNQDWAIQVLFKEYEVANDEAKDKLIARWDNDLRNAANWAVTTDKGQQLRIGRIRTSRDAVFLFVDWDRTSALSIAYQGQTVDVSTSDANVPAAISLWPVVSLSAGPSGAASTAYSLGLLSVPLHTVPLDGGAGGEAQLSIQLLTQGTVELSAQTFTNASTLTLAGDVMYMASGVFYYLKGSIAAGVSLNGTFTSPLSVASDYENVDVLLEVPYTNWPFILLHRLTGYVRQAMPLTIEARGAAALAGSPSMDVDVLLTYEMALAPLVNIKPQVSIDYSVTGNVLTASTTIRVGAALSSLLPFLTRIGVTPDADSNFLYVDVGWNLSGGAWHQAPISVGYSTVF